MSHPYIPFDKTAQVEMVYGLGGNVSENVYNVRGTAEWTIGLLNNLATVFTGWEADVASHHRSHQMGLVHVRLTDLSTQTGPSITVTAGLPINGQVIANVYPENVTFAVKAVTGLRGRSYRGRTYWIGLPEDQVVADELDPTFAAGIVSDLNNLLTLLPGTNGGKMVVASRFNAGAARAVGVTTDVLQYAYTDLTTDSQRRRLIGHNRHR